MKKLKIPNFKTSGTFSDDVELPCLHAKVKNSKLPGVAERYIAKYKDDPECDIYLRAKEASKVTPWQAKILDGFFSGGLAPAINEGMKEYERDGDAYCDASEKERQTIVKNGIAPFITLSGIIIDEIKKEIILTGRTEWDGNLIEHGITIYLRKGRWHFDGADYYIRYIERVEPKAARLKREENEVEKMAEEFSGVGSFMQMCADRGKRWEEVFPLPDPESQSETDVSLLYGDWKFDARETRSVCKKLNIPKDEIDGRIEINKALGDEVYRYSQKCAEVISDGETTLLYHLIKCNRIGNRLTLQGEMPNRKKNSIFTEKYWINEKFLIDAGGTVMRRIIGVQKRVNQILQSASVLT